MCHTRGRDVVDKCQLRKHSLSAGLCIVWIVDLYKSLAIRVRHTCASSVESTSSLAQTLTETQERVSVSLNKCLWFWQLPFQAIHESQVICVLELERECYRDSDPRLFNSCQWDAFEINTQFYTDDVFIELIYNTINLTKKYC